MALRRPITTASWHPVLYTGFVVAVLALLGAAAFVVIIIKNKEAAYREVSGVADLQSQSATQATAPFPISVNPANKTITEDPTVNTYLETYLAYEAVKPVRKNWWNQLTRTLTKHGWYQSLASPTTRILIIWPGDRQEEVTKNFGDILRWDKTERTTFTKTITTTSPELPDGTFFPGRYVVAKDASPEDVALMVHERFKTEVLARYPISIETIIPLTETLTIASLLEREAYEFAQMREISGILWNRLFNNMPLQLDATLQYVKANNLPTATWWPSVDPTDKFISSPYNTYENTGLPPAPIANPSAAAILAALNPIQTDCLFYFHDETGSMYCSVTYEEHVQKLRSLYGQGQ